MLKHLTVAVAAALTVGQAGAAAVTPSFTTFGTLAGATFGGTGIPNDSVAITTVLGGGVTLGLTAHNRFGTGPAVTNDGAGRFLASAGVDPVNPPSPADPYALWNFGFYIGGTGAGALSYQLLYDFDPGVGTEQGDHGGASTITPGSALPSPFQDSWNLGMNFLPTPSFGAFNPNSAGEYSFALIAYDGQREVGRAAIVVNVVPEPGTLALLGVAMLGLGIARRRP